MKIVVKLQDETQMVLDVESSDTVLSVKEKIPDSEVLLRMEKQILSRIKSTKLLVHLEIGTKLFFKGQELEDFSVLADYEIADNDTLHLRIAFSIRQIASNVIYNNLKKPEIITVFVELPNGIRFSPEVDRTIPAFELMEIIPESELIPIVRQIVKPMIPKMKTNAKIELNFIKELSFRGQIISLGDALEKYNIQNDDVIHLNVDVSWKVIGSAKVNHSTDRPKLTTPAASNLPKTTSSESAKVNYRTDDKATENLPKPAATSIKRNGSPKCAVM